ncbi:MAG: zinc-ribbon domain-containing protein [Deltaproteobacteria bacterium]|nr:zinc-ribbon domain-containing protein [Deltaproteobacteria bacterium]
MNFVCDKCKQKYHVADEKIRGRAVTRFRCKKCENVIELRGDALPDPDAPDAPKQADAPDSRPRPATIAPSSPRPAVSPISASSPPGPAAPPARTAARTRAPTSVGVAFNAGMAASAAKAAPRTASTSAILNASETGWYAGIRDLPVGPLTRKELIAKVQSAEVTPDTLVWREGLDDWRPLRNVAELGDVLRLGAQRISGNLIDEMGRRPQPTPPVAPERRSGQVVPLRQPAPASAPALTRPAMTDDDEEATRVTGLDPAIAALIPRTLAAKPAPKPAAEDESGDLTLTEPPHPPPSALGRDVSFAKPAPKISPPHAPAPKAPPPKAPLRAAPAALVQKPAPPPPEPAPEPVVELVAAPQPSLTVESAPSLKVSSLPPAASALAGDDELPEDLFGKKPFPPQSNAPSLESFGLSSAFSSGAPSPISSPAPMAAPPSVQPAPMHLGPMPGHSPTMPGYAQPTAAAAPAQRPVGLSMPVMVLMAGVLVVGVFGGVLLAGRLNRPVPQPIPAPVPVAVPQVQPAAPSVAVAAPTAPEAVPPTPAAPEPVDTEPATPGHPRTARRPGHEPAAAAPGISAAQAAANARLLQQLGGTQGGPSGGPVNSVRLSTQPGGGGDTTPAPTGAARAGRAVRGFQDSRVVNTCWQNLLRQNPAIRDTRVTITLSVNGLGRINRTSVSPSPDPRFDTCINSGANRVAPIGAGESVDAQVAFNFTTGG